VTRPLRILASLLARANRIASARGKKSELARFLRVPRQRINDWLSGARAPGGEVTLQLLEWVQAEEAEQTKSPGRAQTRPEPKTQVRKSWYEKQTQVRKKG
jgi:transcriptional regulator with XRE-family HTH domain